ncbi:hypothetical protein MWH25_08985 [Natroniella acetigena]|uniref:hypothetical protein n=1 Tax=Natroniella acetigena TaxID=52004 RepID=UPI00200B08A5|nr:hypothetical protein [Natroniella acetigena]MCK8827871.1 hypothetical protein [Natroniella acetigena]
MSNYSLSLGTTLDKKEFKFTTSWLKINSILTEQHSLLLSFLKNYQESINNQLKLEVNASENFLETL